MKIEITAETGHSAVYEKQFDTKYKKEDMIVEMLKLHTNLLKEGYEVITYEKKRKQEEEEQF